MKPLDSLLANIAKLGPDLAKQQRKNLISALKPELTATIRRISEIKNLLYRQKPASLRQIFVEPNLSYEDSVVSESELLNHLLCGRRIVIRGSAGRGKSVLLKHLCLKHLDEAVQSAPLFIELRKIEGDSLKDIPSALFDIYKLGDDGPDLSEFKKF